MLFSENVVSVLRAIPTMTFYLLIFLAFDLAYLLTVLLAYLLAIWHLYIWRSIWHIFWHSIWDIFWHSFWQICWRSIWYIFWRSFWHPFWSFLHFLWHTFWIFLAYLLALFLAVEVRHCPLWSGAPGWGPALPPAMKSWRRGWLLRSGATHCDEELERRRMRRMRRGNERKGMERKGDELSQNLTSPGRWGKTCWCYRSRRSKYKYTATPTRGLPGGIQSFTGTAVEVVS